MTYRAWMTDEVYGYRFAFVIVGDYLPVLMLAGRQAKLLGVTLDYLEPMS